MWGVFLVLFWPRSPYLTSKKSFWTQLAPQDPSLVGSKGVQGVKIEVEGYMACAGKLFSLSLFMPQSYFLQHMLHSTLDLHSGSVY